MERTDRFKSVEGLNRALTRALNFIRAKLGENISPTVLWTGNGYHIYLPVSAFILELESICAGFEEPSRRFIQWTEQFLSNNKADSCHSNSLSFKNCMVRVQGSFNSNLVELNEKGEIISIQESAVTPDGFGKFMNLPLNQTSLFTLEYLST